MKFKIRCEVWLKDPKDPTKKRQILWHITRNLKDEAEVKRYISLEYPGHKIIEITKIGKFVAKKERKQYLKRIRAL